MADESVDTGELVTRAMLAAAEAVFVQGFAGLNSALLANAAATVALTSAATRATPTPPTSPTPTPATGATPKGAVTPEMAGLQAQALAAGPRTVKILEDILYTVTAIQVDARNAAPASAPSTRPTAAGSQEASGGPSAFAMIGNAIVGKLASVLGPIAILGQVISSNVSGFQIMGAAVQALAAVLAPVVLPLFIALAGAILDLSDEINNRMLPGLQQFNRIVFGTLVPILSELVSMFEAVIDTLADWMYRFGQFIANIPKMVSDLLARANPFRETSDEENAKVIAQARKEGISDQEIRRAILAQGFSREVADKAFKIANEESGRTGTGELFAGGEGKGGGSGGGGGGGDGKRKGIDDAIESFRLSLGAKASFTGLTDVGKQSQLALLNGDPIQQRILEAGLRAADELTGLRADMRAARGDAAAPPFRRGGDVD